MYEVEEGLRRDFVNVISLGRNNREYIILVIDNRITISVISEVSLSAESAPRLFCGVPISVTI